MRDKAGTGSIGGAFYGRSPARLMRDERRTVTASARDIGAEDLYWLQRLEAAGVLRTSSHHEKNIFRLEEMGLAERHPQGGFRLAEFGRDFMKRLHELREERTHATA